jgi:hypothetical protein
MQSRDHVIPNAGRKEEVKPRLPLTQCRHKIPETVRKGVEGRSPATVPFALVGGFGHGPVSSGWFGVSTEGLSHVIARLQDDGMSLEIDLLFESLEIIENLFDYLRLVPLYVPLYFTR